eukprot:612629-Rhodomonas_salina.3
MCGVGIKHHAHQSDRLCPMFALQPAVWALLQGLVVCIACSFTTCCIGHTAWHDHVHGLLCNLQWALQQGSVCIVQGVLLVLLAVGFQVQSCSRNVVTSP